MTFLVRVWIAVAIAAPAIAQPMTFNAHGLFQVFADGEITADTPTAFSDFVKQNAGSLAQTLTFNSPGGDLLAGLTLGRAIRRAGWSTNIGTPGLSDFLPKPGECDSACTLAFLGGRVRIMANGSKYGVHRFWGKTEGDTQQETQKIAGELVAYIREMGVSAEMYTLMTQGEPEHVKYLDRETMTRARITTKEVVEAKLTDENGVAVVHLTDQDSGGTVYGHMDFYCNGPRFLARVYFPPPAIAFNSSQFSLAWVSSSAANPVQREVSVPQSDYRFRGKDANQIWIDVNVPHALLENWILPAVSIGLVLTQIPGSALDVKQDRVGSGFTPLPSAFRTLAQTMERSCH